MAIVIGVVNIKGGVGKSTLAANIVVELHDRGFRVIFIDAEDDAPTARAVKRFDDSIETVECQRLEEIDETIRSVNDRADIVVVDTPGKSGDAVSTMCLISNVVIVPLQSSKRDLRQASPVVKRIKLVQKALGGKPAASLVLNFTRRRDVAARVFREQLEPLGMPIAVTQIRRLDAYRDNDVVMRDKDLDSDGAATDIRALMNELISPHFGFKQVAND